MSTNISHSTFKVIQKAKCEQILYIKIKLIIIDQSFSYISHMCVVGSHKIINFS